MLALLKLWNYELCLLLKQAQFDWAKTGVGFSDSFFKMTIALFCAKPNQLTERFSIMFIVWTVQQKRLKRLKVECCIIAYFEYLICTDITIINHFNIVT